MRRWALTAVAMAACYRGGSSDESAAAHDDTGGSAGTGADTGEAQGDGAEACTADQLGPAYLRRLTAHEYRGSVETLLGPGLPDVVGAFPDDPVVGGFDNNAEALVIDDRLVERWRDAAETLGAATIGDPDRRALVVGCEPIGDDRAACLEDFARRFGRLAWRHTLDDDELAGLLAVADAAADDDDPWQAIALVIEAALQSPSFVFRVERGDVDPDDPTRVRLRGTEVATRLSMLLLGSTPSAALLDRAEVGELDDADGVEAAARELLADPRARAAMREFYAQWLQLPVLEHVVRDAAEHPQWSETLPATMTEATLALIDAFAWDEAADVRDVLTAPFGFADAELAGLYGVAAPPDGLARIDYGPDDRRGGLLTEASILTLTGKSASGLPIFRGKFLREALLCESLPPPPATVPAIPPAVEGESDRERLERHRTDPACSGCHALLDPAGFGLAEYDAIGAHRTVDSTGAPIDARGSLSGFDGFEFDGPFELAALLHDDPAVSQCLVRQLFRYGAGRRDTEADACTLDGLHQAFDDGGFSMPALIVAFVRSDAFRERPRTEDGP